MGVEIIPPLNSHLMSLDKIVKGKEVGAPSLFDIKTPTFPQLEQYRLKNAPPSMFYIPDFLAKDDQLHLLNSIESAAQSKWVFDKYFKQRYGRSNGAEEKLPEWANEMIGHVGSIESLFFEGKMEHSLTINKYVPGQELEPHFDTKESSMILTMTLSSPGMLDFYYPFRPNDPQILDKETQERHYIGSVWLEPGSLFIFTDAAFDVLLHGSKNQKIDVIHEKVWNRPANLAIGTEVERGMRYAVGNGFLR